MQEADLGILRTKEELVSLQVCFDHIKENLPSDEKKIKYPSKRRNTVWRMFYLFLCRTALDVDATLCGQSILLLCLCRRRRI